MDQFDLSDYDLFLLCQLAHDLDLGYDEPDFDSNCYDIIIEDDFIKIVEKAIELGMKYKDSESINLIIKRINRIIRKELDKGIIRSRKYYKNKSEIDKRYYETHRQECIDRSVKWKQENPELTKEHGRRAMEKHREENREEYNAYMREYRRNKREEERIASGKPPSKRGRPRKNT